MKLRSLIPMTLGVFLGISVYAVGKPMVVEYLASIEEPLCVVDDYDNPGGWVKIFPDSLQPCDDSGCTERLYPSNEMEQFLLEVVIDVRCNGASPDKYFEDAPNPPDLGI